MAVNQAFLLVVARCVRSCQIGTTRHNRPRIGRILMARGRDATDVAISTSFGPCTLAGFKVVTDEVPAAAASAAR
jgi:hypothetical protein